MAELADALDSGSSESNLVQVQVLSRVFKAKLTETLDFSRVFGFSSVMISSKSKIAHKKLTNRSFQIGESPFTVKVYKI